VLVSSSFKDIPVSWQFGCLQKLARIDIHCRDHILRKRQFVECLAHEATQPNDGLTRSNDSFNAVKAMVA
jgi:hypothetical protein